MTSEGGAQGFVTVDLVAGCVELDFALATGVLEIGG